ncbi:hypothetical protein [Nodularia sphaerocarpa]|nr:hypothetical protein [Nodularia sphaerocarpa]MDB9376050.1 hypothetical protein [Nodularia sphaerocarpa CS-585]MDB9380451.1 hypothetical protein [Nodularia sphaerocarpa CS-585A2]
MKNSDHPHHHEHLSPMSEVREAMGKAPPPAIAWDKLEECDRAS